MSEQESFYQERKCPSCFMNWVEVVLEGEKSVEMLCSFCKKCPAGIALVKRRLDVLESAKLIDFPKTMKHMAEYIQWKEAGQ